MVSGAIDATLINPPFNFKAYAAGFTSLGKSAPTSLDVPFNGYAVSKAWAAKNRLLALGVPLEFALYVLPNAKALRMVESGSFIALQHKWTLRTCFNAQEEIYLASMDEIRQVQAVHPHLGRHLGPPCVLRNGLASPRCTEGSHFCGVPVWQSFPAAERRL